MLQLAFGAHSFGQDTFLSLDIGSRDSVLPQSDVSDFVDSTWEALPSLRSRWGTTVEGRWKEKEEGRE